MNINSRSIHMKPFKISEPKVDPSAATRTYVPKPSIPHAEIRRTIPDRFPRLRRASFAAPNAALPNKPKV
jgi:hypothetical protein